jgi:hypothetical protein
VSTPEYLQVNIYKGKREWQLVVWLKTAGGRVPRTVRRFPDIGTGLPIETPFLEVLERLGDLVALSIQEGDEVARQRGRRPPRGTTGGP